MNLSSNKKIIILGLSLLILAGIIVVALKGMNVDLMLAQHKSIDIIIGKEFDIKEVEEICKEVFQSKEVVLKKVEAFGDTVSINAVTIADEEKSNLVTKINEKYGTDLKAEEIDVKSNSNIRVRDLIRPYIIPAVISFVLIYAYIAIRFRKLNPLKTLLKITGIILITEALIASVVAISRIAITPIIINIMFVVGIAEIIIFMYKKETK